MTIAPHYAVMPTVDEAELLVNVADSRKHCALLWSLLHRGGAVLGEGGGVILVGEGWGYTGGGGGG